MDEAGALAGSRIGIGLAVSRPAPDHGSLVAGESQKLEATTQLVVMPYDRFGLEGLGGIRQLELHCHPLSQLKFSRQHRGHAALSEIEGTSGNAGGRSRNAAP